MKANNDMMTNRVKGFQSCILEILFDHESLSYFSNEQGLSGYLNQYVKEEQVAAIYDEIKIEFWKIAKKQLTKKQYKVIQLLGEGYTQVEMAKKLKVCQGTINLTLHGSMNYTNGKRTGFRYGGAIKKLKLLVKNNEKINQLLQEISDLQEERF